jgi:hypothetical protein
MRIPRYQAGQWGSCSTVANSVFASKCFTGFAEEMSLITGRLLTFLEWNTFGVNHLSPNFGQVD